MTKQHLNRMISAIAVATAMLAQPAFADEVATATTTQATPSSPATYTLTVTITGVRSSNGQIMAGLLRADAATGTANQAGGTAAQAVEGVTTLTFTGLTEGDYAVRMFHDENGDGQMSTNMFGIPTEGYGFSNGARASFGPPQFSQMKVEVRADAATNAVMTY